MVGYKYTMAWPSDTGTVFGRLTVYQFDVDLATSGLISGCDHAFTVDLQKFYIATTPTTWINIGSGTGPQGPQGPAGAQGQAAYLQAEQGEDGDRGPQGVAGAAGSAGTTGSQGPIGPPVYLDAEPGDEGPHGPPGSQGPQGIQGSQGNTGAQGPIGPPVYLDAEPGEEGWAGAPGQAGVAGANGATGAQGAVGPSTALLDPPYEQDQWPQVGGVAPVVNAVGTPAVPASTVAITNATGRPVTVYIKAGTLTVITVGGVATGIAAAAPANTCHVIPLAPRQTIAITYSVAPTWVWIGN